MLDYFLLKLSSVYFIVASLTTSASICVCMHEDLCATGLLHAVYFLLVGSLDFMCKLNFLTRVL